MKLYYLHRTVQLFIVVLDMHAWCWNRFLINMFPINNDYGCVLFAHLA